MNFKIDSKKLLSSDTLRIFVFGLTVIIVGFVISLVYLASIQSQLSFLEAWNRWDAPHYLSLARYGYQTIGDEANFIVFYPLFPFLTFLVSLFFNNIFLSSIVVSNLFYVLSIICLYKLVALDYDQKTAWRAVILISIFPTAYFFHAPYTESLFLFCSVISFYLARKNNWLGASLAGLLATLTRVTGLILPIALLVEFIVQKRKPKNYFNLLFLLLIAVGPLIYFSINYMLFKDPLHFLSVQKFHWGHYYFGSPLKNFMDTFHATSWLKEQDKFMLGTMQVVFTFFAFILSVATFFKTRLSYAIYAVLSVILITAPSFWISNPRYALVIFPIFITLAIWSKNKFFYYILTGVFLIMFFIFFSTYLKGPFAF